MFEDATFLSSDVQPAQIRKWMLPALTLNLAIVSAAIVLPLLYPEGLPSRMLMRTLYAPNSAPANTEPRPVTQAQSHTTQLTLNPYIVPTNIPTTTEPGPPPTSANPFSNLGNQIAEFPPGTSVFYTTPPFVQPVRPEPAQPTKAKVSLGVAAGLLLPHAMPAYPPIARAAGISGTVVLAATISPSGVIENLHVLSGHPMLTGAAIETVKTWRYRPYLLNNQPVEVETTINVVFSMNR